MMNLRRCKEGMNNAAIYTREQLRKLQLMKLIYGNLFIFILKFHEFLHFQINNWNGSP